MRRVAIAVLLALGVSANALERGDDLESLRGLFYDLEVAGYCSLASERVGAGFRARRRQLLAGLELDTRELDRLRGEAWQAAHAEWRNRGLGGFRAWCREEGRAAAARLASHAP